MQGEILERSDVSTTGLLGDRTFALQDVESGKVASAKSPRMWPNLLEFHAAFVQPPVPDAALPPVRITMPDGRTVSTDDPDVTRLLSEATGRKVRLITSNPNEGVLEQYVPAVDGADPHDSNVYRDVPNDLFGSGTLHDAAAVHLLTTATLNRLAQLHPASDLDVRRFRPNVVVDSDSQVPYFMENGWLKRHIEIGTINVRITAPMMRCVMITRPQVGLRKDIGLLRVLAEHNRLDVLAMGKYPCLGVAGRVRVAGAVRAGDEVRLMDRF